MVVAVFVGLVYGFVSVAGALLGGDDDETSADSTAPSTAETGGSSTSLSDASIASEVIDPNPSTTTTVPVATAVPTVADPADVLLVGDSEAGGLEPFLEPVVEASGLVVMDTDYKVSSGLVRKDFFDWPARLTEQMAAVNPEIVIALFGGNDGQAFLNTSNPVDSDEWRAEYASRVAEVVEIVTAGGRTLIWVGVPNAEQESLTASLRVQNEVVKTELAKYPEVIFVDAWSVFTGIDGGFAPYVIDPRDGESKPVRSSDNFHLNSTGEEILAVTVNSALTVALRDLGAAI